MKKSIIAVFSVSITAGTIYLAYSQSKKYMINRLVKSWVEEEKKRNTPLTDEQVSSLKSDLDNLNILEVMRLGTYSEEVIKKAPEKTLTPLLTMLKEKKILQKVDLKPVDTLLFGT